MGHGLYQSCPDLFWELFNRKNGFEILDMTLEESKNQIDAKYRHLQYDPKFQPIAQRQTTKCPTQLFVLAKKIGDIPEKISLQQGYYLERGEEDSYTNAIQPSKYCKQ